MENLFNYLQEHGNISPDIARPADLTDATIVPISVGALKRIARNYAGGGSTKVKAQEYALELTAFARSESDVQPSELTTLLKAMVEERELITAVLSDQTASIVINEH